MTRVWLGAATLMLLGWMPIAVQAQDCAGDCNGSDDIQINELISCVNISLGNAEVSSCAPCDVDTDGEVEINELIQSVNASLEGCEPPVGDGICGNGPPAETAAGEECDDGNNFGGDGCAANCTEETMLTGTFSDETMATVQNSGVQIPVTVTGGQTFRAGSGRDVVVRGPGNVELFQPGEVPVVLKATELNFNPVMVSTVACACIRAVEVPDLFGPGNAAAGVIGCGENGLMDINYRVIQDHNTNPGDELNVCQPEEGGAPDDPECDDTSAVAVPGRPTSEGVVSRACREQSGDERCDDSTRFLHPNTCNSPRILTRSGGQGPQGSVFMVNNTSISLLMDSAQCSQTGTVCVEGYGPDCMACTDDDLDIQPANTLPTTSGIAEAAVYDLNNGENAVQFDVCTPAAFVTIDADNGPTGCNGGGAVGPGCITRVEGSPVDCALLETDPEAALSGASLVVAFPSIDAALIKDTVTTTKFANE